MQHVCKKFYSYVLALIDNFDIITDNSQNNETYVLLNTSMYVRRVVIAVMVVTSLSTFPFRISPKRVKILAQFARNKRKIPGSKVSRNMHALLNRALPIKKCHLNDKFKVASALFVSGLLFSSLTSKIVNGIDRR